MLNDLVFTLSERSARYQRFVNLVPARKIEVIPTFLGCQFFEPATPAERATARAALGVGPQTILIGQAADIHFDKRQSDLVLAARRLMDEGLDVMVALKGADHDPIEGRKLEAAIAGAEDRVLRLPRDGRVGAFMQALDVFCISSGREEGPNVAVEAMSAGLPIVSTQVGRMGELSAGGAAALLTPPRDVVAMAAALRRVALDPALRQRMGEAARAVAVVERHADHVVDRIEAGLLRIGRGAGAGARA
jgi:glycosyltransferase involved in cell wall biosynthesis